MYVSIWLKLTFHTLSFISWLELSGNYRKIIKTLGQTCQVALSQLGFGNKYLDHVSKTYSVATYGIRFKFMLIHCFANRPFLDSILTVICVHFSDCQFLLVDLCYPLNVILIFFVFKRPDV